MNEKPDSETERKDFVPTPTGSNEHVDNTPASNADTELELGHRSTYINIGNAADLSQGHRDYLLARHGTLELDPIPDFGDQDPYNWPQWKVCSQRRQRLTRGIYIDSRLRN